MADGDLVSKVEDPKGRTVVLDQGRWDHIKDAHPEMARYLREIMETIREPGQHQENVEPGQDWYFGHWVGPTEWIRVVVDFPETDMGRVKTAHGQRSDP